MFDIAEHTTSKLKELGGTWIDCGSGLRLKLAAWGNRNAQRRFQQEISANPTLKRLIGKKEWTTGVSETEEQLVQDMLVEIVAETVLMDWEGVVERSTPIPFNAANSRRLLKNRTFFGIVREFSEEQAYFREESAAADAEALKKTSSGA